MSSEVKTLFEKIGGKEAIDAAVEIFYGRVLEDETVNRFFETTDMKKQRAKQKAFLAYAFGGPVNYSGKNMRDAHAHLVKRGLNDTHFDAIAGHLHATLTQLGVDSSLIAEVGDIVESTRDDVLDR